MGLALRGRLPRPRTAQALGFADRAQRPHSSSDAKSGRQRHLPHRPLDGVSAAGAGNGALARPDESRRRQAAKLSRHCQHQLRARQGAARDHRHAATGVKAHVHANDIAQCRHCRQPRRSDRDAGGTILDRNHPAGQRAECGTGCAGRRRHRQFHIQTAETDGQGRHDRNLDQQRRHPAYDRRSEQAIQIESLGHRRRLFIHVHDARRLRVFLLAASTHDRHDRGRSSDRKQRRAVMLDRTRQPALAASWTAERESMSADGDAERARRFREAALPHLDDVYTLARYLTRNAADAEDAVQECYLRALRHFDSYRGPAMKPWLLAILQNFCTVDSPRRTSQPMPAEPKEDEQAADELQPWQEPQLSPEAELLRRCDGETIRRLVAALPEPFREAVVLRDINDLSYRDIAEVVGVPVGTVMSRLARPRSMLRARWNVEEGSAT